VSVTSALVVGGGITGSVLALALADRGVSVDLVELSPVWRGVGHGITVQGNALAALAKVGVLDEVLDRGVPFNQLRMRQADGTLIAEVPTPRTGGPGRAPRRPPPSARTCRTCSAGGCTRPASTCGSG
jgi:2-polyprenyl-6-methoxyphenol hydroxylase-like FAD-dependent oxidoreductase